MCLIKFVDLTTSVTNRFKINANFLLNQIIFNEFKNTIRFDVCKSS